MPRILVATVVGGLIGAAIGYFGRCSSGMCPLTSSPWSGALFGAVMGALFTVK